jgi:hypothetical protein
MRRSKTYKQKARKSRRNRRKTSRRMKGGTIMPFGDLKYAFNNITSLAQRGIDTLSVNPLPVLPQTTGGQNPNPYVQNAPPPNISDYNYRV